MIVSTHAPVQAGKPKGLFGFGEWRRKNAPPAAAVRLVKRWVKRWVKRLYPCTNT